MTERRAFPLPPRRTPVVTGSAALATSAWLQWLEAVATWIQRARVLVGTYDWPSISAGASSAASFTMDGAAVGDFVVVSLDPAHPDVVAFGQVTSANTITVRVVNYGAGAVDLAAGTTRIRVEKAR